MGRDSEMSQGTSMCASGGLSPSSASSSFSSREAWLVQASPRREATRDALLHVAQDLPEPTADGRHGTEAVAVQLVHIMTTVPTASECTPDPTRD